MTHCELRIGRFGAGSLTKLNNTAIEKRRPLNCHLYLSETIHKGPPSFLGLGAKVTWKKGGAFLVKWAKSLGNTNPSHFHIQGPNLNYFASVKYIFKKRQIQIKLKMDMEKKVKKLRRK